MFVGHTRTIRPTIHLELSMPVFRVSARCPNGTHKSPSGVCEQVVPHEGLPRCPNGFHRSPSGICEAVNGISGPESNYPSNKTVVPKKISASRLYTEQYGRYSLQVPNDWTTGSPTIKQDSLTNSFSPKNGDDILFIVTVSDRHAVVSESDYEQIIRDENTGTIADTPGATLLQATDCTKYVIDCNQACSMIYTVTENQKNWIYLFIQQSKKSLCLFRDLPLTDICQLQNRC